MSLDVALSHERATVYRGDCIELASVLLPDSIDALVQDPPSGIGFMGREWDGDKGGRDAWIAWLRARMEVAFRVLKPGAHALVWAIPRTSHWTATAVEDAGFEIRDVVMHLFGSGFPKSLDVSKAIDEALGAERTTVGTKMGRPGYTLSGGTGGGGVLGAGLTSKTVEQRIAETTITAPASPEARQWDGWGTALKPACEHWILARKPLAGTVARNVMEHGTGGLNVDGCRIGSDDTRARSSGTFLGGMNDDAFKPDPTRVAGSPSGRWPAHLVLSHSDDCEHTGTVTEEVDVIEPGPERSHGATYELGHGASGQVVGKKSVARDTYRCAPGCAVAMLDAQTSGLHGAGCAQPAQERWADQPGSYGGNIGCGPNGMRFGDAGGASRFFYCAKPARAEKEIGLSHLPIRTAGEATDREEGSAGLDNPRAGAGRTGGARNIHPTVKSVDLMRWLARLITPPGGVVLDMFAGSGTTLVAALEEDFRVIGCELDEPGEYMPILLGRVREALGRFRQLDLFGGVK